MMVLEEINQVVWEPFHKTRLHIHHIISGGHYTSYKLATVENNLSKVLIKNREG